MADSWRWQLRDSEGQWVRMGSRVKWLSRGRTLRGTVVGSPRQNFATVIPDGGGPDKTLDVRRITVDTPLPPLKTPKPPTRATKAKVSTPAAVKTLTPEERRRQWWLERTGSPGPTGTPEQIEALSPVDESLPLKDELRAGENKRRDLLAIAAEAKPGTHVWRGETLDVSPQEAASTGIHWSVNPSQVVTKSPSVVGPGQTDVIWHGVVEEDTQGVPRSHPMWRGLHRSMDSEVEVRLRPGTHIRILGVRTNGEYHKVDRRLIVENKGDLQYKDVPDFAVTAPGDVSTPAAKEFPPLADILKRSAETQRAAALLRDPQSPQGIMEAEEVVKVTTPTELDPYDRMLQHRARAKTDKEYGAAYRRGQTASKNFRGGLTSPLERADSRGEPDAWYDGYHDHAAGLEPDPETPKPSTRSTKAKVSTPAVTTPLSPQGIMEAEEVVKVSKVTVAKQDGKYSVKWTDADGDHAEWFAKAYEANGFAKGVRRSLAAQASKTPDPEPETVVKVKDAQPEAKSPAVQAAEKKALAVDTDTQLAKLYEEQWELRLKQARTTHDVQRSSGSERTSGRFVEKETWGRSIDEALTDFQGKPWDRSGWERAVADYNAQDARLKEIDAEGARLNAIYTENNGWSRAFLVTNQGGHVHRSMSCSTCYPTTRFHWMPEYSGSNENQIVEDAGERACTVCYPSAPVDTLKRATKIFSEDEKRQAVDRIERARVKAEREALKAQKSITNPDGTELWVKDHYDNLRSRGEVVKSEVTARTWYVKNAAELEAGISPNLAEGAPVTRASLEKILVALAAKHGKTIEEIRAELEPKVRARVKRDAKEAADAKAKWGHLYD